MLLVGDDYRCLIDRVAWLPFTPTHSTHATVNGGFVSAKYSLILLAVRGHIVRIYRWLRLPMVATWRCSAFVAWIGWTIAITVSNDDILLSINITTTSSSRPIKRAVWLSVISVRRAEALKKWVCGRSSMGRNLGMGLNPFPDLGIQVCYPREIIVKIFGIWCTLRTSGYLKWDGKSTLFL